LPRYGLGIYIARFPKKRPTPAEEKQLEGLSRARKRLMGFCRTNLFKRLESGGPAFIQSIERHILRNFVYLYAIEEGLDLPLGTQDANLLDTSINDEDEEALYRRQRKRTKGQLLLSTKLLFRFSARPIFADARQRSTSSMPDLIVAASNGCAQRSSMPT
jgi:hypothetical protein